jgi:hypothetical protein
LEAPVCSGVISWTADWKRGKRRSNLTWEESIKISIRWERVEANDSCIRTLIFGSFFFIVFYVSFLSFFLFALCCLFCVSVFIVFSLFFVYVPPPSFSSLFFGSYEFHL